ncbi:asparagine synthase (glutamine-hydrolyzing) [Pedobacter africanus]|uniref:asparagine synthase (glutamine-hydrolyzing) n=1 Tax=Pedobacter africanus TaxID=151894 RepID=A0A1W2BT03_9SPHI|nr:asparagine synthase (glutamine-hydrolyzing) [Pedobacter africanus]SMC76001.1 asparagine synthase (glutamine-hydrolysing) [Pedobacter africanus]
MCGIYVSNIVENASEAKSKLEQIKFRGPDCTGILEVGNIVFGHLRLAILDLDVRSNQPFVHDNLIIVFNGEIYNYLDIKKELVACGYSFHTNSDTEVLIIAYQEWGVGCLDKLNGMFAFSIYNKQTNTLFVARDRLGVKPLYYSWDNGKIEICSQLRPIADEKTINASAVSMFLELTYIPSPFTIYNEVKKLPPGNYMYVDLNSNELTISEYWNLKKVQLVNISYDEAKTELKKLLADAVKIRLQSDVPIGTFLSGGIDSALVTSIASSVAGNTVNTYSIGFDESKYDESRLAETYSSILGTNHTTIKCTPEDVIKHIPQLIGVYDEPFADSSALPSILLASITRQHVTVALSGDGGDESFIGYNYFEWIRKFAYFLKIPGFMRGILGARIIGKIFPKAAKYTELLSISTIHEFILEIFRGFNSITLVREDSWFKHYAKYFQLSNDVYQNAADLNIKLWLENDSNVKVDRASMASSIEVRSPFLDYRIIEFARSLPISFRYRKGVRKKILRDLLKEYIAEDIFTAPKKGFAIPISSWIRNELREEFMQTLSDEFLRTVPNLNVKKFKMMIDAHLNGTRDYSSYIWRVYVLAKWYEEFGFYQGHEKK